MGLRVHIAGLPTLLSVMCAVPIFAAHGPRPAMAQESEEPALPPGLEAAYDPALPAGLENAGEPELPAGLDEDEESEDALPAGLALDESRSPESVALGESNNQGFSLPFEWHAVLDSRAGVRVARPIEEKRSSMAELRLQLHGERSWEFLSSTVAVTADLVYDPVHDIYKPDLIRGEGALDLREASIETTPVEWMDLRLGRQALTWGTGDLLFINDMFPKDWNAFLIGRDMEYLKAPSDALKVSLYHQLASVDLIYTPRFNADRYPDRRRLSSWDPMSQSIVGRELIASDRLPSRWFRDSELAARLYRQVGRTEVAAYGYRGFWKSPAGFDPITSRATFPSLSVYGGSARRPLLGGIAHTEAGYYDSRSDRSGKEGLVRNSEIRALVGFEKEAKQNLTIGLQYYLEYIRDYQAHARSQAPSPVIVDRARHLATLRVRYLAMNQNLQLGLFAFLSPSDQDAFVLPSASYSIDDTWRITAGANLFAGQEDHTFFGQLEANSNVYTSLRATY